jgi:hypothetical protein
MSLSFGFRKSARKWRREKLGQCRSKLPRILRKVHCGVVCAEHLVRFSDLLVQLALPLAHVRHTANSGYWGEADLMRPMLFSLCMTI